VGLPPGVEQFDFAMPMMLMRIPHRPYVIIIGIALSVKKHEPFPCNFEEKEGANGLSGFPRSD
jgi:hypothetical protein